MFFFSSFSFLNSFFLKRHLNIRNLILTPVLNVQTSIEIEPIELSNLLTLSVNMFYIIMKFETLQFSTLTFFFEKIKESGIIYQPVYLLWISLIFGLLGALTVRYRYLLQ